MIESRINVGVTHVQFPMWTGERAYMIPFKKRRGLPEKLARWQPTVDMMLSGVETDNDIYLMIDQGFVLPGATHRRGGIHIDGNWNPTLYAHGHRIDDAPELIILCSDLEGCRGYTEIFNGKPAVGGDCSHIDVSDGRSIPMRANTVYIGNAAMLHEAVPHSLAGFRSLVRLNVPLH